MLNGTQQRNYNVCIALACVGGFRGHCIFWHPWKIMLAHNELTTRHKKSYPSQKMSSLPFLSLCYKYSCKYPLERFYFFSVLSCSQWWIKSYSIFSLFGLILELHLGRALVLHPGRPSQNTKHYRDQSTATTGSLNSADSNSSSPWNASWLQFLN